MLKLTKRVAARYAFEQALGNGSLAIPSWVEGLSERVKVALSYGDPEDYLEVRSDADVFQDAKDSVAVMLSKFMQMLSSKYHDRYRMNATQRSTRMHYYFATQHPLETFVLDLNVRYGKLQMALHFIPHGPTGEPLLAQSKHELEKVSDPELAGLALTRMARKLLSKV